MSALARRLRKKRYRSNPSMRHNPPLFADMMELALPAAGGFIVTRALAKLALAAVERRWPSKSKHVAAAISAATFLGAWFAGHKVKFLEKYHGPITAGSFIAAAVNVFQIYIPKLGWFMGDPTLLTAGGTTAAMMTAPALPDNVEVLDADPALYTWNDSYDAGRLQPSGTPKAPGKDAIADLLSEDDDMGVFSGGLTGN